MIRQIFNEYKNERYYAFVFGQQDAPTPHLRALRGAIVITLHERFAEAVCRILDHDYEDEDNYPFRICRRCLHEEEA